MSYDTKYRVRALEYWSAGHSKTETASVFKVNPSTLQRWKSRFNETGTLTPTKRKETWRKVDPENLKEYIRQHPDAYLKEIAEVFSCSDTAIQKALKRLQITRKKNHSLQGS
jgi:transposase